MFIKKPLSTNSIPHFRLAQSTLPMPEHTLSSDKVHALSLSAGLGINSSPCALGSCELKCDAAPCDSTMHMNATNDSTCSLVNAGPRFYESPSSLLTNDLFHISGALVERSSTCPRHTNRDLRASVVAFDRRSEINTVLGDAKSRLKSAVKLLSQNSGEEIGLGLEKARGRSRLDLNIFLKSNIGVEGGYLQGLIKILIRKHKKKKSEYSGLWWQSRGYRFRERSKTGRGVYRLPKFCYAFR